MEAKRSLFSWFNDLKIRTKLVIIFLVVGILPLIGFGWYTLSKTGSSLTKQVFNQLENSREIKKVQLENYFAARKGDMDVLMETVSTFRRQVFEKLEGNMESKKNEIEAYFRTRFEDIAVLSKNSLVADASVELEEAFLSEGESTGGTMWTMARDKYSRWLKDYKNTYGYYDLYLIAVDGDVVYTVEGGADMGQNVAVGSLKASPLGKCFIDALNAPTFADFQLYAPADNKAAAFIGAPLKKEGDVVGVVALQIPIDAINKIMQARAGMGRTGEMYLVGPDKRMRSDSFLDPENHSIQTSFEGTVQENGVDTEASRSALSGKKGAKVTRDYRGEPVLSAYDTIKVGLHRWAIIADMEVEEAFSPVNAQGAEFFARYKEQYGYFDVFLINPDGYCFYTVAHEDDYQTNLLTGKFRGTHLGALVRKVIENRQFGFADFKPYAPSGNAPAAFIARPLVESGVVDVVVALQLSIDSINEMMRERTGMGTTGETYLVGPDHLMRSDSSIDQKNHSVAASFANPQLGKVETRGAKNALAGKTETQSIKNYNNDQVLSAYAPVDVFDARWALLAEMDENEVMGPVNALRLAMLISILVVGILVVLVGVAGARLMARPIVQVSDVIRKTAAERDLTLQVPVASKDEVGEMAAEMNKMIAVLNESFGQVAEAADSIVTHAKDVAGRATANRERAMLQEKNAVDVEKTVGEMGETAGEVAKHSEEQRREAEASSLKMTDLVKGMTQVSDATAKQTQEANTAVERVTEMGETGAKVVQTSREQGEQVEAVSRAMERIGQAVENMTRAASSATEHGQAALIAAREGSASVNSTVDGMRSIEESSNQIAEIIDVITEIAEQTNLLALNAAIEAARAG
ncbi:MAG: HAMP domain-containing protein, partial [Desulfobacterales bacterium]|nr:HAMP domain-containing protein [Desulfobacterales bacterium]